MSDQHSSTGGLALPNPHSEIRNPKSTEAAWVPVTVAAELLGISRRGAAKRCMTEGWEHRYVSAPESRGRRMEVAVAALPEAARQKWRLWNAECGMVVGQSGEPRAESRAPGSRVPGAGNREPRAESGNSRDVRSGLTVAETREWARESDRAIEAERLAVLDAGERYCEAHVTGRNRVQVIRDFVAHWNATHPDHQVSRATLYEWMRKRREGRTLLPGYAVGPRGQDIAPEILERFERAYLSPQRLSIAVVRRIVQGELALAGTPLAQQVPSTAAFRRHVAGLPRATVTLAREGSEAFRRQFEPHVERDYTTIRVMQCWIADHAQFDFFCRDEGGRAIRPWLTLWQDMRSRRRVGWLVHGGPSQDTVLAALAMGALRYGIPEEAYTDNGRDFSVLTVAGSSRRWRLNLEEPRVRALTEHLGMVWHFALPKQPQGKGGIERAFGTDREQFDKLWGAYCGRNDQEKPEGLPELLKRPKDLPTLRQVQEAYTRYVLEVADILQHEGQGMDGRSPRAAFEAEEYIKRTATAETLRLLLMRCSRPVTVQRNGIWAFDRWYWSIELAACQGQQVYYRYDLDDLSIIHAFSLQDQFLCSVTRRELVGVTSRDHRKYVREKQAVRRIARAHLANLEKRASAPDALAAMGAAAAMSVERREPRPEGPRPQPMVIRPIRTPLEAAARAMKSREVGAESRESRAESRERARAEAGEGLADLGAGVLTGKRKPTREELADAAFEELAG